MEGRLCSTQRATVEEQVAKFLWIISQDTRHSVCSLLFRCSGKFYLVDVGFKLRSGLITPYRGERYHIKEYSQRNPPRNALHNSLMGVDPDEALIAEVDVEIARELIELEDIDNMVAQNQASLNAINVEGSENDLTSLGCQSEVTSRKLKNRCRVKEDNNPIKEAISAMDRATHYLGDVLLLCTNKSSLKDNELLEHLVEIGIEDDDELLRA
ncbi:hypothetical protein Patl1_32389 [Pistacia atlantica]|uniref:Uncharacterized protein n=1 Tax=Pistacia atlantica TaxID=434234 RepID=A0ACC1AQJ2_9ROSI|nr:hypothetical protein Patl1_32389 [Pistacia atlantica]